MHTQCIVAKLLRRVMSTQILDIQLHQRALKYLENEGTRNREILKKLAYFVIFNVLSHKTMKIIEIRGTLS